MSGMVEVCQVCGVREVGDGSTGEVARVASRASRLAVNCSLVTRADQLLHGRQSAWPYGPEARELQPCTQLFSFGREAVGMPLRV